MARATEQDMASQQRVGVIRMHLQWLLRQQRRQGQRSQKSGPIGQVGGGGDKIPAHKLLNIVVSDLHEQ